MSHLKRYKACQNKHNILEKTVCCVRNKGPRSNTLLSPSLYRIWNCEWKKRKLVWKFSNIQKWTKCAITDNYPHFQSRLQSWRKPEASGEQSGVWASYASAEAQHASVPLRPQRQWSACSERCDWLSCNTSARSSVPEQANGGAGLRGAPPCHLQLHRSTNLVWEGTKKESAQRRNPKRCEPKLRSEHTQSAVFSVYSVINNFLWS